MQAGRDEEPPRGDGTAIAKRDAETGIAVAQDLADAASDDRDAVPLDLLAPQGEQLAGSQAVAREEPLHVCGGSVARRPGIDHRDPASCPAEHESRAQTGRTAADHHHVIAGHFHDRRVHRGSGIRQLSLLFPGIRRYAEPR